MFEIYTQDSSGNAIDSKTDVSLAVTQAATSVTANSYVNANTKTVQESSAYTVVVQLAAPLPQGAKVRVEIPSEITDNFDANIMKPVLNSMDINAATSSKVSSSPVTIEMTGAMPSGYYLTKDSIMML